MPLVQTEKTNLDVKSNPNNNKDPDSLKFRKLKHQDETCMIRFEELKVSLDVPPKTPCPIECKIPANLGLQVPREKTTQTSVCQRCVDHNGARATAATAAAAAAAVAAAQRPETRLCVIL